MKYPLEVADLIVKFLNDKLDSEEKDKLEVWVSESEKNRLLFERMKNHGYLKEQLSGYYHIDQDTIWNKIIKRIPGKKVRRLMLPRSYWYAAAAIIILFGAGAFYLFKNNNIKETPIRAQNIKNDLPPGGNKATLTLANGSTIILDNAKNGILAQQSGTQVLKTGTGQLAYSASGDKTVEMLYNRVSTPRGGQYQLTLPDGSKVWLNAASSIRFPVAFAGRERKVEISGEAYFEVSKDKSRPFKVSILPSFTEVEVLGTEFNINAYTDEATLNATLIEGSVRITRQGTVKMLTPGQQAQVSGNGQIVLNENVNLETVVAWKNGWFNFKRTDLRSIMMQISRWYDVEVIFTGDTRDEHFSGIVSRDKKVSEVLKIMEQAGIKFSIEGKKITVMQ
jgi:transmembrane sensor